MGPRLLDEGVWSWRMARSRLILFHASEVMMPTTDRYDAYADFWAVLDADPGEPLDTDGVSHGSHPGDDSEDVHTHS